jgi:hypothetical protein
MLVHVASFSLMQPTRSSFILFCIFGARQMQPTAKLAIQPEPGPVDVLTVGAIAVITYALSTMLHEAVGHGGACLLIGAQPIMVTTVSMDCSADSRLVMAGGTIVNVVAGALFFAWGRITSCASPRLKFFLWLLMTVNLFTAAGYFVFSGIGGFGDWAMFIKGLGPEWAWRVGMTIFGAAAYLVAVRLSLLELRPIIGSDKQQRIVGAARLSKISYFTGGILACVAGSLNPQGFILVVLSAGASTFGGTSGLLWMIDWLKGDRIPLGSKPEPLPIRRGWLWIASAFVVAVVYIAVLGPGLRWRT